MDSPLLEKSMDFATQIVLFYEEFSKSKKDTTIAKQLLRSATSVGANINEAIYGNSTQRKNAIQDDPNRGHFFC